MPTTDPIAPNQPVSETGEHSAAFAESDVCPRNSAAPKRSSSEARRRANRANAQNSSGPKTEEGKSRSSLNATRHGLLAQTLHLPQEEMAAYHEFTASFVKGMSPVGVVETQLAHACADLQFRLNRIAAAEHNLFSIGCVEHGDLWSVQVTDSAPPDCDEEAGASGALDRCARSSKSASHPEAHTALAFAETLRNSPDPLKLLSTYEQRLSRRFLQTFKQLREMQAERRALEQQHLELLSHIAIDLSINGVSRQVIENLDPVDYGFVCSKHSWQLYYRRDRLPASIKKAA